MTDGIPVYKAGPDFEAPQHLPWQDDALCTQTDPDAFFPEKGGTTRLAKKVCASCEVRTECLEYALANDERFGVWGGLSERERRALRRPAPVVAAANVDLALEGEPVHLNRDERRAVVRAAHARKWSDGLTASRTGLTKRTMLRIRRELNLPAWDYDELEKTA